MQDSCISLTHLRRPSFLKNCHTVTVSHPHTFLQAAEGYLCRQGIMLSLSFIYVQSILIILKPSLAIPVNADSTSLSIFSDSATSLTLPPNNTTAFLTTNTNLTTWPNRPFTIAITPLDFTWIWFQRIGSPGTPKQKWLLLSVRLVPGKIHPSFSTYIPTISKR